MVPVQKYRQLAADCYALSVAMSDPTSKAALLVMAQGWIDLAEQAERNDPSDPDSGGTPSNGDTTGRPR